ncbi:MAG TPA: hypothetical protein VFO77_04835 [Actinoplanes sp.]|nr:hypothetical protein [Actinoplanes sp.]
MTGTYDGARLRITEPGRPAGPQLSDPFPEFDFTSPCPPPPGGWTQLDPAKTTEAAVDKAIADASAHPDFAGAWLDQYGGPGTPDNDPTKTVLTLQFTGDLAAHEARARKVWGGSLCVRRAAYSDADLKRIAAEVQTLPGHYEVMVDVTTNSVRLGMYATDAAAQRRLDTRYGPGAVRVAGLLQPID